jgi:uncharacterized iron-regulated membrane protein
MPLKIIWALLDIATIVVLVTGLYLWVRRRRSARAPARMALLVGARAAS